MFIFLVTFQSIPMNLDRVIKEISFPRLILGDINSKHASWGSDISDSRGALINDWIIDNNLYILNDGTPTRYDKYNDKYSNIDISLIDIQQSSKFLWNIKTERAISDHLANVFLGHNFFGHLSAPCVLRC